MSGSLDNRVVSLSLDNSNFEGNAKKSIKTLNDLDSALQFKNGGASFADVEKAAEKTNFSSLLKAADVVKDRFTSMGVAGMAAIQHLTEKAVDAGLEISRSLSGIDNMFAGYNQYVEINNANRTLVNTTHKSLEEVKNTVGILATFADETSYSLQQMQSAMGQMTSAGGDMKSLTPMLMGIANAASFAGRSARDYAGIINQITQSYPTGSLRSDDFRVLNRTYGLFSEDLMKAFIEVGKEVGTLDAKGQTAQKHLAVTTANFGESLKENWATVEVMEKAFGRFGDVSMKAIKIMDDETNSIDTLFDAYRSLEGQVDDVTLAAARSAQETKTLEEALEATRIGIASQWARIFEYFIGDVNEAVELWSNIADNLYTMFIEPQAELADFLGDVLGKHDTDFADTLDDSSLALDKFKEALVADATKNGKLLLDDQIEKADTFRDVLKLAGDGETVSTVLEKIANGTATAEDNFTRIKAVIDDVTAGKYGRWIGEQTKNLKAAGYEVDNLQAIINEVQKATKSGDLSYFEDLDLWVGEADESIQELAEEAKKLGPSLAESLHADDADTGRMVIIRSLSNIIKGIIDRLDTAKKAFMDMFPEVTADEVYTYLQKFEELTEKFKMSEESAEKITKVFSRVAEIAQSIGGVFKSAFHVVQSVFNLIGSIVSKYFGTEKFSFSDWFDTSSTDIIGFLDKVAAGLEKVATWINNLAESKAGEKFSSLFQGGDSKGLDGTTIKWLTGIVALISMGVPLVEEWLYQFDKLKELLTKTFSKSIRDLIYDVGYAVAEFADKIRATVILEGAGAIFLLAASLWILSTINYENLIKGFVALAALIGGVIAIWMKLRAATSAPLNAKGFQDFLNKALGRLLDLGDMSETAKGFLYIAEAMLVLSAAMWIMSKISWEGIAKGLVTCGLAIYAMLKTLMALQEGKPVYTTLLAAIAFIGLAAAMLVLAAAIAVLAIVGPKAYTGLAVVIVTLLVATAALEYLSKNIKNVGALLGAAAALILIGVAMTALAAACVIFSLLGDKVVTGLSAMAAVLLGAIVALDLFSSMANPGTVAAVAASLIMLSVSMVILGAACMIFAYLPEGSWANLILMGIALGVMIMAMNEMQKAANPGKIMALSASMILLSAAALILSLAVKSFASLGVEGFLGIFELAAALTVLGIAAAVIDPAMSFNLIALSAALVVVSIGIAALGLALGVFSGVDFMTMVTGIVAFGSAAIVFGGIAQLLAPVAPAIFTVSAAFDVFAAGLWIVADGIEKAGKGFETFVNAIERLGNVNVNFTDITNSIVAAVKEMKATVKNVTKEFKTDGQDIAREFQNGIDSVTIDLSGPIFKAIADARSGIEALDTNGMGVVMTEKLNAAFSNITIDAAALSGAFAAAAEAQGSTSMFSEMGTASAVAFSSSFTNTILAATSTANVSGATVAKSTKTGLASVDATGTGEFFGQGFVNGVLKKISDAFNAGLDLGNAAKSGAEAAGNVHSPSRVMYKIGEFYQQGFTNAIHDNIDKAWNVAFALGSAAVRALDESTQKGEVASIVPVLDMSQVYTEMDEFDGTWRPLIKPSLDMSDANPSLANMSAIVSGRQAATSAPQTTSAPAAAAPAASVNFTQNNYSPKSLSRIEIYRQTKNLLATANR